jgi:stringent starvation protein B
MDDLSKKKYDFLLYLLEEGDAMVCIDARLPEVDVPASHKNNSSLNLIFNLNFRRPLEITEEGIFASLAFNGRPYKCAIPFEAVWAIYDPKMKNGQVWEESIPEDMNLADQVQLDQPEKPLLKPLKSSGKPAKEPANEPAKDTKTKGKRDRSHLRVIK